MLRHGGFALGWTKQGETNGNTAPNGLAAIVNGLFADKQVFTTTAGLKGKDRGTQGMNLGRCTRHRVNNGSNIFRGHGEGRC